jgi:hypothetical protein
MSEQNEIKKYPEWVVRLQGFHLKENETYPDDLIEHFHIRHFWSYVKAKLQRSPIVRAFIKQHGLQHDYYVMLSKDQHLLFSSKPFDGVRKYSKRIKPDSYWVDSGSISPVTVDNHYYYKGMSNQASLFFHCSEWFKENPVALNGDDYISEEEKQEIEKKKQQEIEKEKAEIEDALKGIIDFDEN